MFDLVAGLPVHPLLVHLVVVLLPVMAVVTPAVIARPAWRPALRWVVAVDLLTFLAMMVTAQAGEALQSRLSQAAGHPVAHDHGEVGDMVPTMALLLFLVALAAMFALRRGGVLVPVAVGLACVVGMAGVGVVVAAGHSGAQASWEQRIAGTPAPTGG